MAKIPMDMNSTEYLIESKVYEQRHRTYLGMSAIGAPCTRSLWYSFHWVTAPGVIIARINRLFNRGHREEALIIADLEDIGIKVSRQQEEVVGFERHVLGHIDGVCENVPEAPKTPHLLEMKTAKEKYFKAMKKKGIRIAEPKYYIQAQRYMGGLGLTRCLFVVTNKDNDERSYERIHFNKSDYDDIVRRERDVVLSDCAPAKLYPKTHANCRFCGHRSICHDGTEPDRNCRTCEHSDLEGNGVWRCSVKDKVLSRKRQTIGCEHWTKGWEL